MTKAEIVNEIALSTGVQRLDVSVVVESFMEVVKNIMLKNKANVYLRGLGRFMIKNRAAKTARNISKNVTITIDAHDLPSFKPSKSFVAQMNQE